MKDRTPWTIERQAAAISRAGNFFARNSDDAAKDSPGAAASSSILAIERLSSDLLPLLARHNQLLPAGDTNRLHDLVNLSDSVDAELVRIGRSIEAIADEVEQFVGNVALTAPTKRVDALLGDAAAAGRAAGAALAVPTLPQPWAPPDWPTES